MRPPKRRHSDPRNTHMASFSLEMPVVVTWSWSDPTSSSLRAAARSVNERGLLGRGGIAARVIGLTAVGIGFAAARVVVGVVVVGVPGVGIGGGLHHPAVDPGDDEDRTEGAEPEVVDEAPGDPREAEG